MWGGHAEEEAMLGRRLHAACTMRALNEHRGKGAARPGTWAGAHRKRSKNQEAGLDEGKSRSKAKGGGRGLGEHQSMRDPRYHVSIVSGMENRGCQGETRPC